MNEIPQIRLTLESMRHEIVMAFQSHQLKIEETVQAILDDEIKKFDFKQEVAAMTGSIFREAIRKSLESAIREIQWDKSIRSELVNAIRKELAKESELGK